MLPGLRESLARKWAWREHHFLAPTLIPRHRQKRSDRMKKIEAIIKPFKLEEVKSGLAELGIEGMTVTEVKGFPTVSIDQPGKPGLAAPRFLPKLKLELIVRNDLLGSAIAAIKECARTDRKDDGKIFVQDLLEVIRIRTEERGDRAI